MVLNTHKQIGLSEPRTKFKSQPKANGPRKKIGDQIGNLRSYGSKMKKKNETISKYKPA